MNKILLAVLLIIGLPAAVQAQMGGGMMGDGMMNGSSPGQREQESQPVSQGAAIFGEECARCHPKGGNSVIKNLPLRGSPQLKDFGTFRSYLRNPVMPDGAPGPMPAYSPQRISETQAQALYRYLGEEGMRPGAPLLSKPLDRSGAIDAVDAYLAKIKNPNLKRGSVRDMGSYFEVEIVTSDNHPVDKLKVDKATGRIVSID